MHPRYPKMYGFLTIYTLTCLWHNSSTPHLIIPWRFFPMVGIINIFQHGFQSKTQANWWFHILFIFIPTWGNDPIWLIMFSNWVGKNHQQTPQEQCGQNVTTLRAGEVWSCKKPTWTLSNLDWMVEKRVMISRQCIATSAEVTRKR